MSALIGVNIDARLPVSQDPNRVPVLAFDAVVVGSGAAGACCAMAAARRGLRVAVVSKGPRRANYTAWARDGIAAVLGAEDSFEQHVQDTLACGGGLSGGRCD